MNGVINVKKPLGITSAGVVYKLRKCLGLKRIGHTGSLDPGAEGVLPVCVGKGARLAEYYTSQRKRYRVEMTLGITTTTQDAFGEVLKSVCPQVGPRETREALHKFVGESSQVPPMYSAVRKNGKHLYDYARSGIEVERKSRQITIYSIEWLAWAEKTAVFDVECSKGTYIRTLCHDVGETLGCGAHMSALCRLASGPFLLENSVSLAEIEEKMNRRDMSFLLPVGWGLTLAAVHLPQDRKESFMKGLSTSLRVLADGAFDLEEGAALQVFSEGMFLGIGKRKGLDLVPEKVIL